MDRELPAPYEGALPYLFVSYFCGDIDCALPILRLLQDGGVRIWHDAGAVWPEELARPLDRSGAFLALISQSWLESQSCRRAFCFAQMRRMPMLAVMLEPVQFTPEIKVQMACARVLSCGGEGPAELREKLLSAPEVALCRSVGERCAGGARRFYLRRASTGQRVFISHSGFKVGRRKDLCDFAAEGNQTVSKVHAVFDLTEEGCCVRDSGSLNHTYVNDEALLEGAERLLVHGDLVEMGSEAFTVEIERAGL